MSSQQWYRAHIRWAVMVPGKEGLRRWEESMLIFLSDDHHSATAHALRFGREHETAWGEECGRRQENVQQRLAEVVSLDLLGTNQTEFEVCLGAKKPGVKLAFEHVFNPGAVPPPASF
jgi:hypothetical protein